MSPDASLTSSGNAVVVPILGMHRSGTSMLTRALNLLGLALGEPLMAPQPDNPKGFWENEFFYSVDVRILDAMGVHVSGYGRRDPLLQVPARSASVERSDDVLGTVESYLRKQFEGAAVWGWKDPRSVLLFPFWLHTLVELGIRDVRPAVITRPPAAVVASMARRTDTSGLAMQLGCSVRQLCLEMWIAYSHVLLDIVEETGCFVSRQACFVDAEQAEPELRRCAGALGLQPSAAQMADALAWLDPGAVHHDGADLRLDTVDGGDLDGTLIDEAETLHEELEGHARSQAAQAAGGFRAA